MSTGEGRNGSSVYDMVTNGFSRVVRDLDGEGQRGVNIPAGWAEEHGVELGDDVAIVEADDQDGVLELHFGDD